MLRVGSSLASCASRRRHDVLINRVAARSLSTSTTSADGGDISSSSNRWQFLVPPSPKQRLLMGCVAYDPAVGQIWDGMKDYLTSSLAVTCHTLTTSSLQITNNKCPLCCGMRDVDRDFRSVALMKRDCLEGGGTVFASGHLVPVDWLVHTVGIDDSTIIPHEYDLGKHGDTAVGEIEAMKAMLDGTGGTSAALVSEMMYQRGLDGALDGITEELRESVVQLRESPPVFDHCSFDALVGDHPSDGGKSTDIDSHPMDMRSAKTNLKLEGINKQWMGPRVDPGGRAFSSSTASFGGERVAVLGAGVSGLQSVRALRAKGFDVTAYDPIQALEVCGDRIIFVWCTRAEVQKYVERYVDHFNLGDSIALNTSVTKVTQNEDGSWSVKIKTKDGKEEDNQFEKVVVATGLYSSKNPSLPGWASGETAADFNGEILHTSQVLQAEQIAGKKVLLLEMVVELLFAAQFRNVTGPTSPFNKVGVVEDFYGYAQVLDYSLRDKVKSGEVDWKVGAIDSFESDGAVLADEYSVFDSATREKLNIESDGLWLFNHTVPTNVDNLAFVGSELAVISNISGYGLQAAWLSKLWSGEINANKQDMESEVNEMKEWKRKWMPNTPSRSSLVLLHQIHWYDRIMRDIGMKASRKSNILSEWFMPYESSDYHGVLTTLEEKK
ncbi:flavin-containing monooxygenase [Skeletonema marinoi]|uniref:Flavin-containing monooxygenase n=1 Tax=Skeletonema marinoi TaxID=267567 RepID=A0AAD8YGA2_9STRA|nr:flavin-containing monooxygenase [Skeletonema marinoi]